MKIRYIVAITILILLGIVFEVLVIYSKVGEFSRLERIIQSAGIFVALLAAIIALSATDRKKKTVRVRIVPSIDKASINQYAHDKLTSELQQFYNKFPDPIESYRVQFKMTNTSGFTLKKPSLSFGLPLQKRHPAELEQRLHRICTFNSNLYNSQEELRLLEFADTLILSNSNLPYWNDGNDITIWIRMALNETVSETFDVVVSVNCENADGVTKNVPINAKELMK